MATTCMPGRAPSILCVDVIAQFLPIGRGQVCRPGIDHDLFDRTAKPVGSFAGLARRCSGVLADVESLIRRVLSHPLCAVEVPLPPTLGIVASVVIPGLHAPYRLHFPLIR